jgi:hypothetical protein
MDACVSMHSRLLAMAPKQLKDGRSFACCGDASSSEPELSLRMPSALSATDASSRASHNEQAFFF